ncbi:Ubiquitin-like modifier-activating enzyme ATG7, variant 2 [Trebouxia sp. C0009 RCD-2024]
MTTLQFQPLKSAVDIAFWSELGDLKLNAWKLSEEKVNLQGTCSTTLGAGMPAFVQLERSSFTQSATAAIQKGHYTVPGSLQNFNTENGFKNCDKALALKHAGQRVWHNILTGAAEEHPSCLCLFLLLSYADLKKFSYWSWFAFPALKPPGPFQVNKTTSLQHEVQPESAVQIAAACDQWRQVAQDHEDQPSGSSSGASQLPFWLLAKPVEGDWQAAPLTAFADVTKQGCLVWLCMSDPSNNPDHPGWPLRNMLLMAAKRWEVTTLSVLCVRDHRGRLDAARSLCLSVTLPTIPPDWEPSSVVGWEANSAGKLAPRQVDLGASMDPRRLAESAVTLNVSLMRWRAAPSLGIDRLQDLKILLLGAGTLGCAVARVLLGWGIRHIDFVDNSQVAFSNPVRQSLYEFEDCLHGGKPKAEAAADKLRQIYPGAVSLGISLTIPMPGHPVAAPQVQQVQADTARLERLIEEHDVVFELMDTRESRWLPTLLAASAGKLVINAALGFDSFLVMRHGGPPAADSSSSLPAAQPRLGCYFCNDVVAPLNSTVDRTVEQQCTVARPGLASIAGAVAVELMACTLQHPLGINAPAAVAGERVNHEELPLGPVPHMIRGQLSGFTQMCLAGQAFRQCTACSQTVVDQYRQSGWPFLWQALQEPKFLEDLTGLTQLHAETHARSISIHEAPLSHPDVEGEDIPDMEDDWTSL